MTFLTSSRWPSTLAILIRILDITKLEFEWLVISFKLKNSPESFMRRMDDILWPLTNFSMVVYLDDIVIFNKICEDKLEHIQQVL